MGREAVSMFQEVAAYKAAASPIRGLGIGLILVGLYALIVGFALAPSSSIASAAGFVVGVLLTVLGGRMIKDPSPQGRVTHAAAMFFVGGVFVVGGIVGTLLDETKSESSLSFCVFGLPFIGWGMYSLMRYRRLGGQFPPKPSKETKQYVGEMIWSVLDLEPEHSESVVEFRSTDLVGTAVRGFFLSTLYPLFGRKIKRWKGLLLDNVALFVTRGHEALCGAKENVSIVPARELVFGEGYKAVLAVGGAKRSGRISKQSYERYLAWKQPPGDGEPSVDVKGAD